MSRFVLLFALCCFFSLSVTQKTLSGTWYISSQSFSCPAVNTWFKINETNTTSHAVTFSHFYPNGTQVQGNCTAIDSVIVCGQLVTNYQCDKTGLFANTWGNATVTWDSYNSLEVNFTILYNNTPVGSNATSCQYFGGKQTFTWQQGDWRVASCNCQDSCCYQVGSTFNIKAVNDFTNKPQANFTGQLTGDYCNNTIVAQDTCYLEYTNTTSLTNMTSYSLNCTVLGCKSPVYFDLFTNVSTYGLLQWNGCQANLVLKGSAADKSTSFGGRLGAVLVMFMVVALLQLLN